MKACERHPRQSFGRVVQPLADSDCLPDQFRFSRSRQPVKVQAAFVVAVLSDAAEGERNRVSAREDRAFRAAGTIPVAGR